MWMKMLSDRRTMALAMIFQALLAFAPTTVQIVNASVSSSAQPVVFQSYGVARISVSRDFTGYLKISIGSNGGGPFFLADLLIVLSYPLDVDLVVDSIALDSATTIPLSGGLHRPIVVPARFYVGDVVTILPELGFVLVREPMGNLALPASGPEGVVIVLKVSSYVSTASVNVLCVALVTGPANETVTMTLG